MGKQIYTIMYYSLVIGRIALLPLFFVSPIFAWFVTLILDYIDYGFAIRAGTKYKTYQQIDKVVDLLFPLYMVLSVLYFGYQESWLFIALFALRIVGSALFQVTKDSKYLIYYPNVMEFLFPVYIIMQITSLTSPILLSIVFVLSYIIKVYHEELLHSKYYIDPVSLAYIKKHPEHERDISQYT